MYALFQPLQGGTRCAFMSTMLLQVKRFVTALGLGVAGVVVPVGALAQDANPNLELGAPVDGDSSDDYLIARRQYALSYNHVANRANWVTWKLDASHLGSVQRHVGHFVSDPSVQPNWLHVVHETYNRSGYDRGHMCPSADWTDTGEDNNATFLLGNILPQSHKLNTGVWEDLEKYSRSLARRGDTMFITAGPVGTIGDMHGVAIPRAFFKIVVVATGLSDVTPTTRTIAVVMPNDASVDGQAWGSYRVSIREVERQTGYDFDTKVARDVQAAIETTVDAGATR